MKAYKAFNNDWTCNGHKFELSTLIADRRFSLKTKKHNHGCLIWFGRKNKQGYGLFDFMGKSILAHRYSAWRHGIIKSPIYIGGKIVAHSCGNKACVYDRHLEKITALDNIRRATKKTHCNRGHELAGNNLYTTKTGRICRICKNIHSRKSKKNIQIVLLSGIKT